MYFKKINIVIVSVFIGLFSSNAWAFLGIDKTYLLFDEKTRNQEIRVSNRSDIDKIYKVAFIHYEQDRSGGYKKIEKETSHVKFAENFLIYTPKQFTIRAKGSQIIRLQRRSMADANDGEYISHIIIQEQENSQNKEKVEKYTPKPNEMSIKLTPLFAISIPIVVRKGDLQVSSKIKTLNLKADKDGNHYLDMTLERNGNRSIRGDIIVKYNEAILGELKGVNVFLGKHNRQVSLPLDSNQIQRIKQSKRDVNISILYLDSITNEVLDEKSIKFS